MKISKRVREEAAVLCAMMASYRAASYDYQYGRGRKDPVSDDWNHVAWAAFDAAWCSRRIKNRLVIQWADAEALLRTGWSP